MKSQFLKITFSMVSLVISMASLKAHAVPVMNENAAASPEATIYPDHQDANTFYIAPNYLSVCLDEKNVPRFSYQDLPSGRGLHGIVQMTLCSRYNQPDLDKAEAAIVAKQPAAQFRSVPFAKSAVIFNPVMKPYIVKEFCSHQAGQVGDEQTCSFELNSLGRTMFIRQVRDRVVLTLQYNYTVNAFMKKPDNSVAAQDYAMGLAIRIGGEELKNHPELFADERGRTLNVRK